MDSSTIVKNNNNNNSENNTDNNNSNSGNSPLTESAQALLKLRSGTVSSGSHGQSQRPRRNTTPSKFAQTKKLKEQEVSNYDHLHIQRDP